MISIHTYHSDAPFETHGRDFVISTWINGTQEISTTLHLTLEEAIDLAEQLARVLDESRSQTT